MIQDVTMAYVNVAEWSPRHVAEWLRGLDDTVQPYVQFFLNNNINGCHLLTLASNDLIHLNVVKIGHQEVILEAVDLLRQLHYNLTSENLQSLCLKLGCKARSLCNVLKQQSLTEKSKNLVSTETLSSVSDILALVKILISWLDRYPFEGQDEYKVVRKTILQHSIELASTAQRDKFAEKPHETIQKSCHNISEQCDTIVQKFNDSLIIQPASLRVATVKKRSDEDLGIHIHSSYSGIHIIGAVKFQSPAYRCGKICEGDEIIQVNYQTVVGWQLKNLVCATSEHPSEIHLTVKKRPHHSNALEDVITIWPFRIPSKRTAFKKMNKWSKIKCTHMPVSEVYSPPLPLSSSSKDMNGSQHIGSNTMLPLDGIRQPVSQPLNSDSPFKRRPRVNRRVTIDSVPSLMIHSPVNITELKSAFKVIEPSNVREKYSTYNANKTSDSGNPTSPRILCPVPCKFGSTDSDKWKRENEKNRAVANDSETNSEMKYASPDVHQEQVSLLNCRQNGQSNDNNTEGDDTVDTTTKNDVKVQQYPSANSNFPNSCITSSFTVNKETTPPTTKNDHAKVTETILEEKVYNTETDTFSCQEDSLECSIDSSKYSAETEEDLLNNPESDGRNITRFQVVSFPSPGVNTRTFIRQDTRNKKSVQNVIGEGSKKEEGPEKSTSSLTNQSDTDFSEGQSDTSLEDIANCSKYIKQESSKTLCQPCKGPIYNNIPINYEKNITSREELLNYRKQKSKIPRAHRRFTTDQPLLLREMESENCSAFRPISGRSMSCIDMSQIVENSNKDNARNSKCFVSKNSPPSANDEISVNLHNVQNESNNEHWPLSSSEAANYIRSLDRRTILTKYQDSNGTHTMHDRMQKLSKHPMHKQKELHVSAGYVAKIAESFNSLSKQQEIQLLNTGRNEPPLLPTTVGQLYHPVSSYASIMKPKPLRGDQLLAFMQNKPCTIIHERQFNNVITAQENSCFQLQKALTYTEDNVKESRKECSDLKQINRFLRTATSEEIQNMYTTYGNSGRVFEGMHTNNDIVRTASSREEGKIVATDQNLFMAETENKCKHFEFQAGNQKKSSSTKKHQKQAAEQLAQKLKTLILGEKEEMISEKHALVGQPIDTTLDTRSRISAAVQTDTLEDNNSCYEDSCLNTSFASQESSHGNGEVFYNKPCQNMSDDSVVYSSNSSLTSSTSSGSHYYYVETQIRPELTLSVPLVSQVPSEELSDSNRSSHLPRMGVAAMLGKKRTVSYGSSDSGSGEVNTRLEQMKDFSPTHKSFLGHSAIPIDV